MKNRIYSFFLGRDRMDGGGRGDGSGVQPEKAIAPSGGRFW
ncbi:MAG: hypothetical protein PHX16_08135 [Syntrophaceticus sp.]|nr:hypothetical protein [Syntrophaceticus sp.]